MGLSQSRRGEGDAEEGLALDAGAPSSPDGDAPALAIVVAGLTPNTSTSYNAHYAIIPKQLS